MKILSCFSISIGLIITVLVRPVFAQTAAGPLADIIAAQSQYPQRIRSIQVKLHAENVIVPQGRTQEWDTIYSAKGDKYLEQEHWIGANSPPPVLYNGGSSYFMTYDNSAANGSQTKTAETKLKKRENPAPHVLSFGYQWREYWIADLMQRDEFHLVGTESDPQFGTLYHVEGIARKGQPYPYGLAFWFAPQYGFLAVRTEAQPADGNGMKLVWRVTELMNQDNLWFAKSGVREAYGMGTNNVMVRYTMTVSDIQLNAVPDSLFDPSLPAGGKLYDQDANIVYRVGPQGEKVVDRRFADTGQTRRMVIGILFIVSLTFLILLGIERLVRWRRRQATL